MTPPSAEPPASTSPEPSSPEAHADWLEAVAAQGDREAFSQLFSFFAPRVKGYLMRMRLGAAEAEEMMQEVMVAVWRKAGSYDRRRASASTWIFRIARNRRIDAARKEARSDYDPYDPSLWPQAETPADVEVETRERETEIAAAMAELPAEQLELVRLAFFSGLSHSEIAEARKLPLGTVKSRLRLALQKLKARLGDVSTS